MCSAEHFKGRCHKQSVIVMKTAVYGRMHLGTCMEVDVGYLGCQNDVLYLVDRWCSGRSQCDVYVPNDELKHANSECDVRGLSLFLEVEFDCIPSKCQRSSLYVKFRLKLITIDPERLREQTGSNP